MQYTDEELAFLAQQGNCQGVALYLRPKGRSFTATTDKSCADSLSTEAEESAAQGSGTL